MNELLARIALPGAGDQAAADSIAPAKPSCGNCKYAKRLDLQFIECHGVPPTPVVMGATQGAFGKVALNIELMRARLSVNELPCALWALNPVNSLLNLPGMKSA